MNIIEREVLLRDINRDMPLITPNLIKTPMRSHTLPKDFGKELKYAHNKFLDNYSCYIEDDKWLYWEEKNKFIPKVKGGGRMGNLSTGFNFNIPRNGDLLEIGSEITSITSDAGSGLAVKLPLGVVGQYYNEVAVDISGGSSTSLKEGVYSAQSTGFNFPDVLYESNGVSSFDYSFVSLTEFQLTTDIVWAAITPTDDGTVKVWAGIIDPQGIGTLLTPDHTNSLPNPGGGSWNFTYNHLMHAKIAHT